MRWWDGSRWTEHVSAPAQPAMGPGLPPARIDWSGQPWSNDPANDKTMGLIAQLIALLGGIIGAGIFYAVTKERSQFVRHHATEALNFTITLTIVSFVLPIAMFGLMAVGLFALGEGAMFGGFFLIFPVAMALSVVALVLPIMAMLAANRGEWYRYPVIFRFVKGPLDTG